jgi:hypothetical protein
VGSIAKTAILLFWAIRSPISALTRVLLPAPGGPVIPIIGVDLVRCRLFKSSSAPRSPFSTMVKALATDLKLSLFKDNKISGAVFDAIAVQMKINYHKIFNYLPENYLFR